jgi:hypothetical protein
MERIEERLTVVENAINNLAGNIDQGQLKYLNENFPEIIKKMGEAICIISTHNDLSKTNETGNEKVRNSGILREDAVAGDFTSSKAMNIKDFFITKMIDNPIVIPASKTTFRSWIYSKKEISDYVSSTESKQHLGDIKQKAMDSGFDDNAVSTKYNKAMYLLTWNYLKSRPCAPVTTIYDKIVTNHTKYKDDILIAEQNKKGDQI